VVFGFLAEHVLGQSAAAVPSLLGGPPTTDSSGAPSSDTAPDGA
jgi:hypothetical protein